MHNNQRTKAVSVAHLTDQSGIIPNDIMTLIMEILDLFRRLIFDEWQHHHIDLPSHHPVAEDKCSKLGTVESTISIEVLITKERNDFFQNRSTRLNYFTSHDISIHHRYAPRLESLVDCAFARGNATSEPERNH